jgi:hypothetical protein
VLGTPISRLACSLCERLPQSERGFCAAANSSSCLLATERSECALTQEGSEVARALLLREAPGHAAEGPLLDVSRCAYVGIRRRSASQATSIQTPDPKRASARAYVPSAFLRQKLQQFGYPLFLRIVAGIDKTLDRVLRGTSDANISFSSMRQLLAKCGFQERIKGSHHIFTRTGVEEILNLQPNGPKCKPYQVKQVRSVILRYKLAESRNA